MSRHSSSYVIVRVDEQLGKRVSADEGSGFSRRTKLVLLAGGVVGLLFIAFVAFTLIGENQGGDGPPIIVDGFDGATLDSNQWNSSESPLLFVKEGELF